MISDKQAEKLVADVARMVSEIRLIARDDKDPRRRAQARRWIRVMQRESEYAIQCRDNARRGR
jgi:hypothetical protein